VPALLAVALGSFLTLGLLVETSPRVRAWDLAVATSLADDTSPIVTDIAKYVTDFGDRSIYMVLGSVVVGALLAVRRFRLAAFLGAVVIGQWLLTNSIKGLVGRERPDVNQLVSASGYSFPSGHTSAAAATYLALAIVLAVLRPQWNLRLLTAGAITIAVFVGATRVLLGVHWTTDVLAGLAFGWTWCLLCAWVFGVRPTPLSSAKASSTVPA
jgi:undecaprenyl-diphosphatase